MKTFLILLITTFSLTSVTAQDIVGQWKGTLKVQGAQLRVIFNVTKIDNRYLSTVDSPDQGASGIVVTNTIFENSKIKFEVTNLEIEYNGKLKEDEIIGTFRQGNEEFPMNLSRQVKEEKVTKQRQKPNQFNSQQFTNQHTGLKGSGSTSPFHMVAVDKNTIWASCSNSNVKVKEFTPNLITHTEDGGTTWKNDILPAETPNKFYIACIHAISKDRAWVSCIDNMDLYKRSNWKSKIYATFDGGDSWEVQDVPFSEGYGGQIHFFNRKEGIVFAGNADGYFQVFKTCNAGKTWKRLPESNFPKIQSVNEFSSDDGYYALKDIIWIGTKGRILKSIDKGTTWTAYNTPLTDNDYIFEVTFSDAQHGIARYTNHGDYYTKNMIATSDGGENWTIVQPKGLDDKIFDLNSVPNKPGEFLCTSYSNNEITSNKLYHSKDNGVTWSELGQMNAPGRISLFSSEIGWVSEIDPNTSDIDVYKINGAIGLK